MANIRLKGGTRAQIEAAAAASQLNLREPYYITDEGSLAVGTSTSTFESFTKVRKGISLATRTVTADTTVTVDDYTLRCNCLANSIVVNLPLASAVTGSVFVVKKVANTVYQVTLDPNGSELIDGSTSAAINLFNQSLTIQSNGTSWDIL